MTSFVKWASLNQFHEVMKSINYRKYADILANKFGNKLELYGKIKMHGTNASVTITPEGKVIAGKRSSFLPEGGIGADNAGFAAWVFLRQDYFRSLARKDCTVTVYGEWCGPGVQHGVACSGTINKMFYIFAVNVKNFMTNEEELTGNPTDIEYYVDFDSQMPNDVIILPWHSKVTLDFTNADSMRETLNAINKEVEAIGERDPFMFDNFEIEGAGEGLVFYPTMLEQPAGCYYGADDIEFFKVFNFKAKSEHHRVNKTKEAVVANPEKIATQKNFCDMFCTEARFEQAFDEAVGRQKDMRLTSDFIRWVCVDVMKESTTEREGLDIEWKALGGAVSGRAAQWYKAKVHEV